MDTLFQSLIFGHLIGDYVLQNKWMAVNKSASSFKSIIHCLIYTFQIGIFTKFYPMWLLFVFSSHFLIDRFSLADKWLKLINGRSLNDFYNNGHLNIPEDIGHNGAYKDTNYRILRGGFTALVYCVVDNTIHLLSMYYVWRIMYGV